VSETGSAGKNGEEGQNGGAWGRDLKFVTKGEKEPREKVGFVKKGPVDKWWRSLKKGRDRSRVRKHGHSVRTTGRRSNFALRGTQNEIRSDDPSQKAGNR